MSDARHALRALGKNPAFAAVAVLTIGLGIGANTAVFTLVSAVFIQGLPYASSDRLVTLHETDLQASGERSQVSFPNFRDWQNELRSADAMASYAYGPRMLLKTGRVAQQILAASVSWNYFEVLGVGPVLGRSFTPADDLEGAPRAAIISDSLWDQAFSRDPSTIGRTITLNREPWTIVGVLPRGFMGPPDTTGVLDDIQIWRPISAATTRGLLNARGIAWISPVVARLRPAVSVAQAQRELDTVVARLAAHFPEDNRQRGAIVEPIETAFFGRMDRVVTVLFAAVGLVLLIACVNLANLMLVRGGAREREWALRGALGAGRGRIARLVMVESLLIALLGGALGTLLAAWMIDLLVAMSPVPFPPFVDLRINLPVLGYMFLICLGSSALFGALPAISAGRVDLLRALKTGGRDTTPGGSLMRKPLVAAQIALALVLLVGAGLLLRTIQELHAFDPGFQWRGLLAIRVARFDDAWPTPPSSEYNTEFAVLGRSLLERVRALAGVEGAALSWDVPMTDMWGPAIARIEGRADDRVRIRRHRVTPGYFRTLGVPVLAGRDFASTDDASAGQHVAVISRRMANRFGPGSSALHQRLTLSQRSLEIVGIVGDIQHVSLLESADAEPDVYVALDQAPSPAFEVVIRTGAWPEPLVAAVRQLLGELDASIQITKVRTGDQIFGAQIARQRFTSALLSTFALAAILLTMIGVYGVTAYSVSGLTKQIGVRMALGADRLDVLRLVLDGELGFIAMGIIAGVSAGLGVTRALSTMIYGVTPTDPLTFGAATALLAAIALIACLIPARRAMRVDPVVALRAE